MIKHFLQLFIWRARKKKAVGFLTITMILLFSLLGNALTYYIFEQDTYRAANNEDLSFVDCLWCSVISISTIGYGDMYATTIGSRIGTVVFIVIIGLAAFTTFFGIVLDWFMDLQNRERRGMCKVFDKDHILIINYPSAQRVKQVIEELANEEVSKGRPVVVVTDAVQELTFAIPNVSFVYGSPIEEETYERANIHHAKEAIILCTSPDDPNSDSVVASIVSIIEDIEPNLLTVAECLDEKHRRLFESSKCDSIVYSTKIINNLLVHESMDTGVIRLVDEITTQRKGDTLYTVVAEDVEQKPISCIDLAKALLDNGLNLLCINRGERSITNFTNHELAVGDVLIYVGKLRKTWTEVKRMISK